MGLLFSNTSMIPESTRIDVDYASNDAGNHEESLMTDEMFTLVYFVNVKLLPQVHYEKTMDIF